MTFKKKISCTVIFVVSMALNLTAQGLLFIPNSEPAQVASEDFGNKSIRMVMNAFGEPVISFGKNGSLFVAKWNSFSNQFDTPIEIDPNEDVFISDAEGPSLANKGNYLVLTYQISGQWTTGARSVHSVDGGLTWSEPVPMAPNATENTYMPCVAVDDENNPFAGIKIGNDPTTVFEGVLRSIDSGMSWLDPVNASEEIDGVAVCECCASLPFMAEGKYYNIVRNNNDDVRDFWLISSDDGVIWDNAIDIDPLDWTLEACPASGPSVTGPIVDGKYIVAFMSAAGLSGQGRIYLSEVDLQANGGNGEWILTQPATLTQFDNATQNVPVLTQWNGSDEPLVALAWEQNTGGYDIQLSLSQGNNWNLTDVAQNLTEGSPGQHRRPALAFSTSDDQEPILHVAWQHSSSGTVHYMTGTIGEPSMVNSSGPQEPRVTHQANGIRFYIPENWCNATWSVWDVSGRLVTSGVYDGGESVWVGNTALPRYAIFSVESPNGARWAQSITR